MDELVRVLVGEHQEQYVMDAYFHHAIDTLAQMLPMWVEGIATNCGKEAQRNSEEIERIMRTGS